MKLLQIILVVYTLYVSGVMLLVGTWQLTHGVRATYPKRVIGFIFVAIMWCIILLWTD